VAVAAVGAVAAAVAAEAEAEAEAAVAAVAAVRPMMVALLVSKSIRTVTVVSSRIQTLLSLSMSTALVRTVTRRTEWTIFATAGRAAT
jgi:hypothetical protein